MTDVADRVLCQIKIEPKSSLSARPVATAPDDRSEPRIDCVRRQDLASPLPSSLIAAAMNLYLQLLLLTVSGWVNLHQQCVIEYLQTENRALREQLGPKRIRTKTVIANLVVSMARDNPNWGYTRIREALHNLGHDVARNTVKRFLVESGLEPAPERGRHTSWATFLRADMGAIAAQTSSPSR